MIDPIMASLLFGSPSLIIGIPLKRKETAEEEKEEVPFDDPCDGNCETCGACDDPDDFDELDPPMYGIPDIKKICFADNKTVVFWEDGTETVVECAACDKFDKYAGFSAACMKKMFGSTEEAKAVMDEFTENRLRGKRAKCYILDDHAGIDAQTIKEAIDEALNG